MTDKELFDELDRRVNESKDSFISFVKSELESEYKNCKDRRGRVMLDRINGGILRCIYLFTMEEHSFYSSGDALDRIYRLLTNQHLIPITEDDFEDNDNTNLWVQIDQRYIFQVRIQLSFEDEDIAMKNWKDINSIISVIKRRMNK